jgi:hypothetical protein
MIEGAGVGVKMADESDSFFRTLSTRPRVSQKVADFWAMPFARGDGIDCAIHGTR